MQVIPDTLGVDGELLSSRLDSRVLTLCLRVFHGEGAGGKGNIAAGSRGGGCRQEMTVTTNPRNETRMILEDA